MSADSKGENRGLIAPHIATIMQAYGDPSGKYQKYLDETDVDYRSKSYWFYDQPGALAGSSQKKRSVEWRREETSDNNSPCESDLPVAFQRAFCVELEDGLCVTWEQLKILFCLIAI